MKTLSIRREGINFSFEENGGMVSIGYSGYMPGLPPLYTPSKVSGGGGESKIPDGKTLEEFCEDVVNEFFNKQEKIE